MKLNIVFYLALCFSTLFLISCTRTFKLHTTSFDHFDPSRSQDSLKVKTFKEGIYFFPLLTGTKRVDGIDFNWFVTDTNKINGDEPIEYAYLVFLDKNRVYYYSSLREEAISSKNRFGMVCLDSALCQLRVTDIPNSIKMDLPSTSTKKNLLPHIKKEFVINQKGAVYRLRGYYSITTELIKKKDTTLIEHYVNLDMEPPSPTIRKKVHSPTSDPWKSNGKQWVKDKKRKFKFRLAEKSDTLYLDSFEMPKPKNIAPANTPRILQSDSLLAFVPTFTFVEADYTIKYRDDNNQYHKIQDIQHAKDGKSIYYILPNQRVIRESLEAPVHIMSW